MKKPQKKNGLSKIIAIVGPTATGKSDLAIILAKKLNGEVISADSRQVYRGLNLGTGKVTKKEMRGIPHHLIDVANPRSVYTAAQFAKDAERALQNILNSEKTPIIVGGTGFYLSVLLGEIKLPEVEPNKKLRSSLEKLSTKRLLQRLEKLNSEQALVIDRNNRHRIIRAIEVLSALGHIPQSRRTPRYNVLKIGIDLPDNKLKEKIALRLVSRIRRGMLAEARHLHEKGLSWKRMESLGLEYRFIAQYLKGGLPRKEMEKELNTKIWQYAKRQRTWFKRDKEIHWFSPKDTKKIENLARVFLRP